MVDVFELNSFQEIFIVAFSILYGVMLQTFVNRKAFPWMKLRVSKITGFNLETVLTNVERLFSSILVINILPFGYALIAI